MEQAEEGNDEDDDQDDPDSEASEKLIEYAGDVLPALGSAMTPQEFAPYFAGLLPSILQRTVRDFPSILVAILFLFFLFFFRRLQKKHCTIAEKSFSAGVLAVCMEPLDGVLEPFVPHLYTAFTTLMRDSDSEVRNNSVFGLGELVLHGRELLYPLVVRLYFCPFSHYVLIKFRSIGISHKSCRPCRPLYPARITRLRWTTFAPPLLV